MYVCIFTYIHIYIIKTSFYKILMRFERFLAPKAFHATHLQ